VRHVDGDQLLIEEMLRPPPLEEARNSLEFWRQRRRALPLYRRTARREADEMIRRTNALVEAAARRRYGTGLPGLIRRLFAGEPLPWTFAIRPSLITLALRLAPRRLVLGAAAAAAAALLLFSGVAVAIVMLLIHAA
jgi:hypothetical protein